MTSHLLLATKLRYDGRITEASKISTRRQPQLGHKNFSLQLQLNFSVGAESLVYHMQSNSRFMFSFSCKMRLMITTFALLPKELTIKNNEAAKTGDIFLNFRILRSKL